MQKLEIIKKQFIAGAVCPECDVVDRIVVEVTVEAVTEAQLSRRRCVDCGFADEFSSTQKNLASGVPKGRPERARVAAVQASAVRILDPAAERP